MVLTCLYPLQCLLIGYATVVLIYRSQLVSWPLALGLGISLGCCEVALLFFYAGLGGVRPGGSTLLAGCAAAIAVIVALHFAGRDVLPHWPADWKPDHPWWQYLWYVFPVGLLAYAGFTAVHIATSAPLIDWDA